jgi:hypothetical protein
MLISLSGSNNGHIFTLDSGGVLAGWPSTHRWTHVFAWCVEFICTICSYRVPTFGAVLGLLDKAYNSVPGGVGSNPPHAISVYARLNRLWALRVYCGVTRAIPAGVYGMMSIEGEC